jgi:hypothetical protein
MPRGIHKDAEHLHDLLDKAVILDKDRVDGSVDLNDPTEVYVGIIVDVSGYGPHIGALYVEQNRYHGHPDTALQGADEILTEWMLEYHADDGYIDELQKEWGDEWMDILTETFDGWAFELSPHEFVRAIAGTDAEKFIDVEPARKFEVVVGNIGTVYTGTDEDEADHVYDEYVEQSQSGRGRAAGEDVTLFQDGEPTREWVGEGEERAEAPRRARAPRGRARENGCPPGYESYMARYVHQISPSPEDVAGPFCIRGGAWSNSKTLAAELRKVGVLDSGARVRNFRSEGEKVIVFPMMPGLTTYWHSVILTPA